jgi:uncharacterized protein (DUF1684 family)
MSSLREPCHPDEERAMPDDPAANEVERAPTWLDLYDWRQRVAALYRERAGALRRGEDAAAVFARFCRARDALFAHHPQTPLSATDRAAFTGLHYHPYDAAYRVTAELALLEDPEPAELPASGAHAMRFHRAGRASATLAGQPISLLVYWIDVYGGGLFLPFRDSTSNLTTYGGGRYLFDTVKGSDFLRLDASADDRRAVGYAGGAIELDFNYAYNPSCAYDARWLCPLSPPDNRLALPITAGELAYHVAR